ncbi:MAG: hypothetical protein J0M08_05645 [Bacteroidetes bacterium]|nr:hypothetical protein [Bacteroidota bacterium]
MDILIQLISSLSKEEQRNFKLFLNRTNSSAERKDEMLFNYIKNSYPNYDEENINKKLYYTEDKNALYRLKNRLAEDVSKSLYLLHYAISDYNKCLYYISLSHVFFNKKNKTLLQFFIKKAEVTGVQNEFYDLLIVIYNFKIKIASDFLEVSPEEFINQRNNAQKTLDKLNQIEEVVAVLSYRIRTFQLHTSSKQNKVLELLEKTIKEFSKDKTIKNSTTFKVKTYNAISRILLQKQDYVSLERYLRHTYADFKKNNLFDKNNHEVKIQLITYWINALYKNQKYYDSLKLTTELKNAIEEFNYLHYEKYLFFYYNSRIINYSTLENSFEKRVSILTEAINNHIIQKQTNHLAILYSNLALAYFDNQDYKNALRNILKLINSRHFEQLDMGFQCKLIFAELMIRFELNDIEYVSAQFLKIKRKYNAFLKLPSNSRDKDFLNLLTLLSKDYRHTKKKKLVISSLKIFTNKYSNENYNDVINYNPWIEKQIEIIKGHTTNKLQNH